MNGGASAGYFYDEPAFGGALVLLRNAQSISLRETAAQRMDRVFTTGHWCVAIGGAKTHIQLMSARIGRYHGETLYGGQHLRTLLTRLTVADD